TQFKLHLNKGSNNIDNLARFFQIERCSSYPFRHILHERNKSLKIANHITLDSLGFVILFLYIRLEIDMGNKIRLVLRKFANFYSFKTLNDNLNCAIRHTYHTGNTRDGTNFEYVVLSGLFYF